jgi:hypothetical protein
MKGEYEIKISNTRVQFKIKLKRNLTILRGDSATGKTTLIQMVADYEQNKAASGVNIQSDKECRVLSGSYWKQRLNELHDSFVFIDEGEHFVSEYEFAKLIRGSSNYYIIASRESFPMLPYSVEEIYKLTNTTARYANVKKFYTQNERMYNQSTSELMPDLVIVEDSNAGFEFYKALCQKLNIECITARGKSNVAKTLQAAQAEHILVIADGAAFGPEMEQVWTLAQHKNADLFLPESFEWVILKSGLIKNWSSPQATIQEILDNPSDFIESQEYFSWEKFFTNLLINASKDTYLQYNKSVLNPNYLQEHEMDSISKQLPKNISL